VFKTIITSLLVAGVLATTASAGAVERSCQRSKRSAVSDQLCACIDAVSRKTLTVRQQNRAARLILDADMAERVNRSKLKADKDFWKDYRSFASVAQKSCKR
jgi:hypothetical protein